MNKQELIDKWNEKHSEVLNEYAKGSDNNEVMKMFRSQMKNILEFISDLEKLDSDQIKPSQVKYCGNCKYRDSNGYIEPCHSCDNSFSNHELSEKDK